MPPAQCQYPPSVAVAPADSKSAPPPDYGSLPLSSIAPHVPVAPLYSPVPDQSHPSPLDLAQDIRYQPQSAYQ